MRMTQLILQHSQQIPHNPHPLLQQRNPLIHLKITPHSLIHRLELRFRPHQLRGIEHTPLEMDVDAQDEQFANLHVDLAAGEVDAAGAGDGGGDGLGGCDCCVEEVFVEGGLIRYSSMISMLFHKT